MTVHFLKLFQYVELIYTHMGTQSRIRKVVSFFSRGWSMSCWFVHWWYWSFTTRRLPSSSPHFWKPTILLFFLLICSIRCAWPACCLSHSVCFAFLCYIPFCSAFSPRHLRFPSQEFLPSSDLSICSWHYPDALILGPLKTWLFWSCFSLKPK